MLDRIREERVKCIEWKNIKPIWKAINSLPKVDDIRVEIDSVISIYSDSFTEDDEKVIYSTAKLMQPWRKGPFRVSKTFIDSEWRSFIKYELLKPHFNITNKIVGDIGCNNGYYLFRMLNEKPKKLVGFDPSPIPYCQFKFIDHFLKSGITYELLGVEHIEFYEHKFDTLFCLGVLYHRSDPIGSLKSLYRGLNSGGELILDTFMIDGDDEVSLTPKKRYSKIPNVYFIPTINALKNWCYRAGFENLEVIGVSKTEPYEQRKTDWIDGESLEDFLDRDDNSRTVEGYPAPKRVYLKAKKIKK